MHLSVLSRRSPKGEDGCPFSLDRMVSVSDDGKVVYRAEKAECQPFPILGDGKLLRGAPRNFEVFDPLDFLAEITQHPPSPFVATADRHPPVACPTKLPERSRVLE